MGKHGKRGEYGEYKPGRDGTDDGRSFSNLSPMEKAAEFDASHNDPVDYANRNFTPSEGKHKK